MSVPFYFKLKQPFRGLFAVIFTVVIAAIFYYVGSQKFWYEESVQPLSWIIFTNFLILLFVWMFVYAYYFQFWPWSKLSQPLQGLAITFTIIVCAGVTYYIMYHMAHWGAYIFGISSAWLFWILVLSGWTDYPLAVQYAGRQVLGGVSAFFITLGLGLLTWYTLPAVFLGNATGGLPFIWFLTSTLIGLCLKDFPVQIAHPWRVFGFVGWFAALTFLFIWVFKAAGVDALAVSYPVPAGMDTAGNPVFEAARGSTAMLCVLVAIIAPIALFQYWPFHKLPPLQKGFAWMAISTGLGIAAYFIVTSVSVDPVVISKVVTWGFCIFVGMFVYYTNFGGALAPDPASDGAVAAAVQTPADGTATA